ncbi:uncharacterized protein EHS24_003684 [Apiotrichum porosum]|uniref:Uncharacterized protein n=1 Tax=Apiotrichum porosum TaxID=105984 RepID=A0A427XDR2_9TREE|nr:uncharacterized protein EHS24_003684 [Apiotrichum porosum]RSH77060.1 hypothetical protein EHS24_003684 [Apiotrichum porosum]
MSTSIPGYAVAPQVPTSTLASTTRSGPARRPATYPPGMTIWILGISAALTVAFALGATIMVAIGELGAGGMYFALAALFVLVVISCKE